MRDFKHTMDILVKAYLNDTLKHGDCAACAVGNICGGSDWGNIFATSGLVEPVQKRYSPDFSRGELPFSAMGDYQSGLRLIESTGYSIEELMRVEFAFESAPRGNSDDDFMFNGLMAVLDVLADIHQVDLSGKKIYQEALTEIYNS